MRVDDKKKEKAEHQTAQQQPDFHSQVPCDRSPTFTKSLPFSAPWCLYLENRSAEVGAL